MLTAFLERSAAASDANDGASADVDEGTALAANPAKRTAWELRALCAAVTRARTSEAGEPA